MIDAVALGSGLVGNFVISELAKRDYSIHVIDLKIPNDIKQNRDLTYCEGDIFKLIDTLPESKLIINMLPGKIGQNLRSIFISKGRDIIDIAFTEQDPSLLNNLAEQSGSTVLWDVGIAPGLSNMIIKKEYMKNENFSDITVKVGGNPAQPDENWSYMAPFSPYDVIEEYTRPARILQHGNPITVPALSDLHVIDVNGYGKMEAFLTDGLRSLLKSNFAPNMREYTVRWPGHINKWLENKSHISDDELVKEWKFDIARGEFTWMEIKLLSPEAEINWIISDVGRDGNSSMARTTGLVTIACVIELLEFKSSHQQSGVFAPEQLPNESIDRVIEFLIDEGIRVNRFVR